MTRIVHKKYRFSYNERLNAKLDKVEGKVKVETLNLNVVGSLTKHTQDIYYKNKPKQRKGKKKPWVGNKTRHLLDLF